MECVDFFSRLTHQRLERLRFSSVGWRTDSWRVGELARFRKRWRTVYVKRLLDSTYTMQVGLLASF